MARRLHLIDIENLAYDAFDCYGVARDRLEHYLDAAWRLGDFVTIASNARLWHRLAWDMPVEHRYIVPPTGQNSADQALLACAAEFDLDTFEGVWIGSGDHAFTDLARRAAAIGLWVNVVANRGAIAHSLRDAADTVHELPPIGMASRRAECGGSSSMSAERLPRRRAHSRSARPFRSPGSPHETRRLRSTARRAGVRT